MRVQSAEPDQQVATTSTGLSRETPLRKNGPDARPKLRAAVSDDYERVAALQIRNGLPAKSREEWLALWTSNPVYRQTNGKWPIGSVLETDTKDIVGFIANIPVAFHFQGHQLRGAVTSSWVVDPAYRGYSLMVLNSVTKRNGVDLFITDTVGSKAEPALRILQWSRVPAGIWDKSYFWITNYRGFVRAALNRKSVPLAGLLAYPASLALACRDRFIFNDTAIRPSSCKVDLCREFDTRFDTFWEELKSRKGRVLMSARTRETLEWHFRSLLDRGAAWVLTISQGPRLIAYAIFDRQDNTGLGLKRVRLIDFQAVRSEQDALSATLFWMLRKCRADGVHVLESTGSLIESLGPPGSVAPYQRNLDAWRYFYKATNPELAKSLRDSKAWAPSPYDGDTSL